MSEKIQHTAASLREKMINRYSDGLDHKHNKNHLHYRQHCRSHPSNHINGNGEEVLAEGPTGLIRKFKLRKMRKRLDRGHIH